MKKPPDVISMIRKYQKQHAAKMVDKSYFDFGRVHFSVAPKPTLAQKKAETILEKHLGGYKGVIAHGTWSALKGEFVTLMERRRKRK